MLHLVNTHEKHEKKNMVIGGAHGVMVIVVGNGQGDMSSKPGRA